MKNLSITQLAADSWRVSFDGFGITFATESEAREYVDQLHTRLVAPHVWPTGTDESLVCDALRPKD